MSYSSNVEILQRMCPPTLCPWLRASAQQHRWKETKAWGPIVGAYRRLYSLHRSPVPTHCLPLSAGEHAEEQFSPCSFSIIMLFLSLLISLDTWIRQKRWMLQATNCFVPALKWDAHMENSELWLEVTTYLLLWYCCINSEWGLWYGNRYKGFVRLQSQVCSSPFSAMNLSILHVWGN